MKRRSDLMKITEILIRAGIGIKPTHLLSDTRLKHGAGYEVFDKLLKLQFLEIVPVGSDNKGRWPLSLFKTTDKGMVFVDRVLECYRMIGDNSLAKMIKKVRVI